MSTCLWRYWNQEIRKACRIHPLSVQYHGNPSNSGWGISDQSGRLTIITIPRATLIAWLKMICDPKKIIFTTLVTKVNLQLTDGSLRNPVYCLIKLSCLPLFFRDQPKVSICSVISHNLMKIIVTLLTAGAHRPCTGRAQIHRQRNTH